jgi:transcriptional regulator with XRE-family HTH domain
MPTALAELLRERIESGESLRAIARGAGLGASTVRRVIDGADVRHSTIAALADYLTLPTGEVFRLSGIDANENEGDDLLDALILMLLAKLPVDVKRQAVAILRILAGE